MSASRHAPVSAATTLAAVLLVVSVSSLPSTSSATGSLADVSLYVFFLPYTLSLGCSISWRCSGEYPAIWQLLTSERLAFNLVLASFDRCLSPENAV
jgi:hypothetical protein